MTAWFKKFNSAATPQDWGGDRARVAFQKLYYERQIVYIEDFLEKHSLVFAQAYFDKLKTLKGDGFRKDNETPDIGHEIDQLLNFIIPLDFGSLKNGWEAIIEEHGSIDALLSGVISHDIKEDYGLFTGELYTDILARVEKIQGHKATYGQKEFLFDAENRSEDLTHYRKFDLKKFEEMTGTKLGPLNKKQKVVGLEQFLPFFQTQMNRTETPDDYYSPSVFAEYDKKKKKWQVIVTAYGKPAPNYGTDWDRYILQVNRDVFTGIIKLGDRIQGVSTRIAVNEGAKAYDEYLDATDFMFYNLKSIISDYHKKYSQGPFGEFMRNQKQMLGLVITMGQMVVQHHEINNGRGGKGWSADILKKAMKLGENPIDLERFFPSAGNAYERVPLNSNPLVTFFRQLKDYVDRSGDENIGTLHEVMLDAVGVYGGRKLENKIRNHIDHIFPPVPTRDKGKDQNISGGTILPFLSL